MLNKKIISIAAIVLTIGLVAPAITWAHGGERDNNFRGEGRLTSVVNRNSEDHRGNNDHKGRDHDKDWFFYQGKAGGVVSAKSETGFTLQLRNRSLQVNTTNASLIRVPDSVIALSDISIGDKVLVVGTRTNTTISATEVYVVPATMEKAKAKGTVTAVNNDTITIQTKNGETVNLETTDNTIITEQGISNATTADIAVGDEVKVKGFWDSMADKLYALKIKVF